MRKILLAVKNTDANMNGFTGGERFRELDPGRHKHFYIHFCVDACFAKAIALLVCVRVRQGQSCALVLRLFIVFFLPAAFYHKCPRTGESVSSFQKKQIGSYEPVHRAAGEKMARFLLRFMSFLVDLCLRIPVICKVITVLRAEIPPFYEPVMHKE